MLLLVHYHVIIVFIQDDNEQEIVETWDPESDDEIPSSDSTEQRLPYTQRRLIKWYTVALFTFQFLFSVSDAALHYLFAFISAFFTLVVKVVCSPGLLTFSNNLPKTFVQAQKVIVSRQNDVFKVYVACPSCSKLYVRAKCTLVQSNRVKVSKACTHVEFPSHPWSSFRRACGTHLMKCVKSSTGKTFFYPKLSYCYMPLVDSLAIMLPRLKPHLNLWKNRIIPSGLIADVYDGNIWQDFLSFMGQRPCSVCLSLTLNVDWFEPYKYVKHSIGAMYVVINNLPRHMRFKPSNIILLGLIPGPDLPENINHYLSPLVDELKELAVGVSINGEVVRAMLSCIANDIPAARKVCGFANFNARLGCSRCLKVFPTEQFGDAPDYSGFDVETWPKRSNAQMLLAGTKYLQAQTNNARKSVVRDYGCRYTILSDLSYLNLVRHTIIDPMHNLFLGTAKHILEAWKELGIISESKLAGIQNKIDSIVVPRQVGRIPGKILHGFSKFTADQWKTWTLIFSIFCLHNVIPSVHMECWRLFVYSCALYTSKVLTRETIDEANASIIKFCKRAENLYGKKFCTPNMHLHCHLVECFKDYGPAHSFWLFTFERYNGILGDLPTNHRSITVQLMKKFTRYMHLKAIHEQLPLDFRATLSPFMDSDLTTGSLGDSLDVTDITMQKISFQSANIGGVDYSRDNITKLLPTITEMVLTSVQLELLQTLYLNLYPSRRPCRIKRVVKASSRAQSGDILLSTYKVNPATSYVVAKWGQDMSNRQLHYGKISLLFSLEFHDSSDLENTIAGTITLAQVDWYKPHPCSNILGFPWVICSCNYYPLSFQSFIPISRIMSSCAFTDYVIQPQENTDYSHENVVALAPVKHSLSEFVQLYRY